MRRLFVLALAAALSLEAKVAKYQLESAGEKRASVIASFTFKIGEGWRQLDAVKVDGGRFQVWLKGETEAYLLRDGNGRTVEFRNATSGQAVLPTHGAWPYMMPPADAGERVALLGHWYKRVALSDGGVDVLPADPRVVMLRPDLLIGPASNTRQVDETRRWDESDYKLKKLTRADYFEMAAAGVSFVRVDDEQAAWADEAGLFYWGAMDKLPYPEILYRSQWMGPVIYLDEPAVHTRDFAIRPRMARDAAFKKALQPQTPLEPFKEEFRKSADAAGWAMMKGLAKRADVDLGDMHFRQANVYSWETMFATAAYELTAEGDFPAAIVFEPPGRIGTRRTIPELNMALGTSLSADDPKTLTSVIYGFLRGAARQTNKEWGVSIYGAVQKQDTFYWLTRAYDLGATRFHFWDNYQLACVPYGEVLAMARHLRDHAAANPRRDLAKLRRAAEVAILVPPGYDLGHVFTGRALPWGLPELNLERVNRAGVKHRVVMANLYREMQRAIETGLEFDAMWKLDGLKLDGYRKVVEIREDGKVINGGDIRRLEGNAPRLEVMLTGTSSKDAAKVSATATVQEGSSAVYYTFGADPKGEYHNAMVMWEVYGPEDEDYRFVQAEKMRPNVKLTAAGAIVETGFDLSNPGAYRLRASTVDTAGRTTVVWKQIEVIRDGEGMLRLR